MENKKDIQPKNQLSSPISENIDITQNPISLLLDEKISNQQNNQHKSNVFIQKRNRMDDSEHQKMEIEKEKRKNSEKNDSGSETYMRPLNDLQNKNNKINILNNNHDQFICKKMSLDIDDDITNSNALNKKVNGCNCKNSGCLKRYCECFSRMKYCDENCQCKNCINNVKYEKERGDAIKLYLIKSPVSFKKINMDINNISCNCKKSNCLKNYCECYQYNLKCTYSCGCVDCKNRNLYEKKMFHVENSYNKTKNTNHENNNIIKLQEEEVNVNNGKNNNNNNINKKSINNPQFIINKDDNNNINTLSPDVFRNRKRYFSFDDEVSHISQWTNLNLKKIEISNKNVIIDNYNVKQPENIAFLYQELQNNTQNINNVNGINNYKNNSIKLRKNSAFSAIVK